MIIKRIAISLYALFGSLFVIAGASVLLQRTGLLPDALGNFIRDVTKENANTLHIVQEFGSLKPLSKCNDIFLVSRPRFGRRLAHAYSSANEL